MILREANPADIAFVMATERLPGYETTVGQWTEAEHLAEMRNVASRYLIGEESGAPVAFALLQTLDDPGGNVYLKRIAVTRQGQGVGKRMMRLVEAWVFSRPHVHRLHLHFSALNERGRRLYKAVGFQEEGVEREVFRLEDGTRVDSVRASILRPEWEALAEG